MDNHQNSKDIFNRQNELPFVNAQKVAKYCYRRGKILAACLAVVLLLIPIAVNIIIPLINNDIFNGIMAILLIIAFVGGQVIRKLLEKQKFYGAGMQQYFDECVFDLKNLCRKYIVPRKITLSLRLELIKKYEKKDHTPFINWYPDYSALSYDKAVFYCQKENVRWDSDIRNMYRTYLICIALLLGTGVIINAVLQRMEVIKLLAIIISGLPITSYFFTGFQKLVEDINDQRSLMHHIEKLEHALNEGINIWDGVEELQVEIFNYRKKAYLIPDWFHEIFRKRFQGRADLFASHISGEHKKDQVDKED